MTKAFVLRVRATAATMGAGLVIGCGGGGDPVEPPPAVSVSISPTNPTLGAGETQQFTATVTNSTQGVTWTATGGSVSGTGTTVTWTAPASGGTYSVRAASVEDPTKSATATTTVTSVALTVSPTTSTTFRREEVALTAAVTGSSLNGVTWTTSCGTVAGTGASVTWTAPDAAGTCTVTVRSAVDNAISAVATMTVRGTWRVSSMNDADDGACSWTHCSLREALTASNTQAGSDSIQFLVAGAAFGNTTSTISLTAALPVITGAVHIVGPGPDVLTIDATGSVANQRRVLDFDGATGSVTGIRLRGGVATGGGGVNLDNASDIEFRNVMVVENESRGGDGGGLRVRNSSIARLTAGSIVEANKVFGTDQPGAGISVGAGGALVMTGGRIRDNVVENGWGGGLRVNAGTVTLTGVDVEGNQVLAGAFGGAGMLIDGQSTLTFDDVTISGNSAPAGEGGGARILTGVTGTITNSTISNNSANGGAGIVLGNVGAFAVTGTTITGNTAATRAGGAWLWGTSDVTFTGSTVSDNVALTTGGGGIYLQHTAKARLNNCTVSRNETFVTGQVGGGIFATSGTSVIMTGGVIEENNTESGWGAGLYASGSSSVSLTDVAIRNNTGGIAIGAGMALIDGATLTMMGGSVTGNVATQAAGGGMIARSSTASIQNVTFQDNDADVQGGGMQLLGSSNVTLANVTFRNNHSAGNGGGIGMFGTSVLNVSNSLFEGNTTPTSGGAIGKGEASQLTVTDSRFIGNQATLQSGAMHLVGTGNATISRSTFSGNTSVTGGGAITTGATMLVETSTFTGNAAGTLASPALGQGGAIFSASTANSTIRNSTISGNSATTLGGGISVTGQATLTSLTIVNNTALTFGGGLGANNNGAVTISSSLLAGNMVGIDAINCGAGGLAMITSTGYNLSDNFSCSLADIGSADVAAPFFNHPTDLVNVPAGISTTLADNGGPTQTHAVLTGSAAINAGNPAACPTTDQRGYSRQGTCDIGAFEFGGAAPAPGSSPRIGARPAVTRVTLKAARSRSGKAGMFAPDPAKNGGVAMPDVVR